MNMNTLNTKIAKAHYAELSELYLELAADEQHPDQMGTVLWVNPLIPDEPIWMSVERWLAEP
jgi:hypothetical protein